MKLFSKVIVLGSLLSLLLVAPTFTRDHNHCCQSKAVGSYIVTVTQPNGTVNNRGIAILHEDGTMFFSEFDDEKTSFTPYAGSWKCVTKSCIEFCATNVEIAQSLQTPLKTFQITGTACFKTDGSLCGTDFTYRNFLDEKCTGAKGPLNVCFKPQSCNLTNSCGE